MSIIGADGNILSETEGITAIFDLLSIMPESEDEICETSDGVYIISPTKLRKFGYNTATGEIIFDIPNSPEEEEMLAGWSHNNYTCRRDCRFKCWVDRGWTYSRIK